MKSKFLKLNLKDFFKGLLLAIITTFVSTSVNLINTLISTGIFDLSWSVFKPGISIAILAAVSYLIKNLFTNSKDQTFTTEP